MGHSCLLSIAEPPFFDLKIEASCGFCRKVPTLPIDVIGRGQKASCLDSLSVQSSWFLLSRYWFKIFISFFSAGLVATVKVLMFKSLKLGFQCELPSQEWESVASASLQIQSDFSSFSKNTNEKLTIVRIWQMLQYYKITKCKTFLQSSWLAKEVGKPTRCAASCQIARGELSLMHLYNTCIIHIIMTHAIYVQIWHICYIYILLSH